jgi:hypothetical protein
MRVGGWRWSSAQAILWPFVAFGCAPNELDIRAVGDLDYGGRVERIETLGRYSSLDATVLFQLAGARAPVAAKNDYYLYRVLYPTRAVHGGSTIVSGLVAIPVTRHIKGVVSWQHGTNTYRPESISKPSALEGLGLSALFAGDGYLFVAADYIGLGVSHEVHPYYHWPSTVSTVVDLIAIADIMLTELADTPDHDLYLAGFSQGGAATSAVQAFLEKDNSTGLTLRGAAAISGAHNMRDISLPYALESELGGFYLGLFSAAFSYVYQQPLDGIVREPYLQNLPRWFDGSHDAAFLTDHLPKYAHELLESSFLKDYAEGIENPKWYYDAFRSADTFDYTPQAPLRILYGSRDETVIPKESTTTFARMQKAGGNVELLEVGPFDHDEIVPPSMPIIQRWFDDLDGSSR